MDRIEKREFVAELSAVFAGTSMVVVTRNAGMTVADVTELRRRMRAAGASFKVAKNRLALLALDGTRFDGLKPFMKGPTAISWSTDPVAVAKAAVDFAKTNEKFVLVGGALGTRRIAVARYVARQAAGDAEYPGDEDCGRVAGAGRTARTGFCGVCRCQQERGGLTDFLPTLSLSAGPRGVALRKPNQSLLNRKTKA